MIVPNQFNLWLQQFQQYCYKKKKYYAWNINLIFFLQNYTVEIALVSNVFFSQKDTPHSNLFDLLNSLLYGWKPNLKNQFYLQVHWRNSPPYAQHPASKESIN
jgi:hypothetical protein